MSKTTLTFVMDGDIPLKEFAEGVDVLNKLIVALTREVGGSAEIQWLIDELHVGSAVATIKGVSEHADTVERVVQSYSVVGRSLQNDAVIPYSPQVVARAHEIRKLLGGNVTSIRFETANEGSVISSDRFPSAPVPLDSLGQVEGIVQTLTERNDLRFILYDSLYDRAVYCYVSSDRYELMRDIWGRRVVVEGRVSRDPLSGRPMSVREISEITPVPDVEAGGYRAARGVSPRGEGAPSAVEAIRRLRDV